MIMIDDLYNTSIHMSCFKVRTCFVAPKFSGPKDEPRPASLVHQVDYPLDGGRILRIEGQIRCFYFAWI